MQRSLMPFQLSGKQAGALFGLDARIALAIFGVLSVVAGVAMILDLDDTRGKTLANELLDTGQALEEMTHDLNTDLFPALDQPSEKNAYTALFDNAVLKDDGRLRPQWLGPYVRFTSTEHPRYGSMAIQARQLEAGSPCAPGADCYLWVVYPNVKPDIVKSVNGIIDGPKEASPDKSGRIQWTISDNQAALSYRAAKTISYTGD